MTVVSRSGREVVKGGIALEESVILILSCFYLPIFSPISGSFHVCLGRELSWSLCVCVCFEV